MTGNGLVVYDRSTAGDNELVIQSSDATYKRSYARGYNAVITEDSRYVVFKIKPFYKDTRMQRSKRKSR
jgi:hypothetical protein